MRQPDLPKMILKDYLAFIGQENNLPATYYTYSQWGKMMEKTEQFISSYKDDATFLRFFYSWYNYRKAYRVQMPLDKAFKDTIPKGRFEQMYQLWNSLEQDALTYSKENQKNREIEQER